MDLKNVTGINNKIKVTSGFLLHQREGEPVPLPLSCLTKRHYKGTSSREVGSFSFHGGSIPSL